jgi:hypothetical protein
VNTKHMQDKVQSARASIHPPVAFEPSRGTPWESRFACLKMYLDRRGRRGVSGLFYLCLVCSRYLGKYSYSTLFINLLSNVLNIEEREKWKSIKIK